MKNEPFSICIGRQLCSGGRDVAHLLARELDAAYFDKEILAIAAHDSGYSKEVFARNDERKGFFGYAARAFTMAYQGCDFYKNQLGDDTLFELQSNAIRHAAETQNCLFMGRLADYVLRDHARMVSVFVCADEDDRLARLMQAEGLDRRTALKKMEKVDGQRASFYNFYSGKTWGAAPSYDLCINSSRLGIEGTARYVKQFVLATLERR